jgi:hypothetical protein
VTSRIFFVAILTSFGLACAATDRAMADGPVRKIRRLPATDAVYTPIDWEAHASRLYGPRVGSPVVRGQAYGLLASFDAPGCDSGGDCGCSDACGCDTDCGGDCIDCCGCGESWSDNFRLFVAGDGWKHRADDNSVPNNFGFRIGFNSGWGLGELPIRAQVGASYGFYDISGRRPLVGGRTNVNWMSVEQQLFLTLGFYKRSDVLSCDRISWGIVYDYMYDTDYGEDAQSVDFGQARFQVGYALTECSELGLWGAFGLENETYVSNGGGIGGANLFPITLRPMDQVAVYWKRNWCYGGETSLYVGAAENIGGFLIGLNGDVPLSSAVGLTGGFHYIVPANRQTGDPVANFNQGSIEETWMMTFGIAWYPGQKASACTVSGNAGMPLLPVANNGTFAVEGPRVNF